METPEEIRVRWRYLRDLLIDQLGRFEGGAMQMHAGDENTSPDVISHLKQNILDFDTLIARSGRPSRRHPEGAADAVAPRAALQRQGLRR
jgi:hypothetical protein